MTVCQPLMSSSSLIATSFMWNMPATVGGGSGAVQAARRCLASPAYAAALIFCRSRSVVPPHIPAISGFASV